MYSKYVKLRNDKGITDYRVAIDTGIRRSIFSDWKSGRSKPKTDKCLKFCGLFWRVC